MQKNIEKLFTLLKKEIPLGERSCYEWFVLLTQVAKQAWIDGVVTQEVSDILDILVSDLLYEDKDHAEYTRWMSRRAAATTSVCKLYTLYCKCFSRVSIDANAKILDVGSRESMGLKVLKECGYTDIRGIEICKEAADRCNEIPVDIGDIHKTTYDSNTFDLVIIKDTLEHCYDPEKVIEELYRIVKDGGYIFWGFPTEIALSWNNCKRIKIESFLEWIHAAGFISIWMEAEEKVEKSKLYHGSFVGILKKYKKG